MYKRHDDSHLYYDQNADTASVHDVLILGERVNVCEIYLEQVLNSSPNVFYDLASPGIQSDQIYHCHNKNNPITFSDIMARPSLLGT